MFAGEIDDVCYFGVLTALLLRWATSLWPYSGAGKPPMFGDYEAQRHWQEVTVNLPVTQWYENSTTNDLLYWGLDYPPLTAYHSWLCGKVAEVINGSWVALNASRGMESYDHKLFMRYTVLAADVLVYFPAVLLFWNSLCTPLRIKPRDVAIQSTLTLIVPGLVLIDHGHFQYNCVSLGLSLLAMALYYAVPFFCYLLGCCFQREGLGSKLRLFLGLALAVTSTFGACWAPYLGSPDRALQVVKRLFPLDRGLFEDKVANIWCTLSIVVKLKNLYSPTALAFASGLVTLGTASISAVDVLLRPTPERFRFTLINCSLAFFLCSYQVHEKTILFPALAFYLILNKHPGLVVWFSTLATFSMFPLLFKDGLVTPYFCPRRAEPGVRVPGLLKRRCEERSCNIAVCAVTHGMHRTQRSSPHDAATGTLPRPAPAAECGLQLWPFCSVPRLHTLPAVPVASITIYQAQEKQTVED
ncbi:hypothetical protein MRX96_029904 [Rhipicephalus microplus]